MLTTFNNTMSQCSNYRPDAKFTQTLIANTTCNAMNISADGSTIVYLNTSNNVFLSTDYGVSFTQKTTITNVTVTGRDLIIVSNGGTYIILYKSTTSSSSNALYSNDSGNTWNTIPTLTMRIYSINMSGNGQYMCASGDTSANLRVSSDYGVTWVSRSTNAKIQGNAVSENGQYMVVNMNIDPIANNTTTCYVLYSNDYGATFTNKYCQHLTYGRRCIVKNSGAVLLTSLGSPGAIWMSEDELNTFFQPSTNLMSIINSTMQAGIDKENTFACSDDLNLIYFIKGSNTTNYNFWYSSDKLKSATSVSKVPNFGAVNGKVYASSNCKYVMIYTNVLRLYSFA